MLPTITINNRVIGRHHPTYIIAELSANHGGSFETAVQLIHAAARAGVDAVKLQTYTADTMTLPSQAPSFRHRKTSLWAHRTLHELYLEAATPWEWHPKLQHIAHGLGMTLFSSPFDATAVDFLESMNVPAYKIASFELIDIPLLRRVATTGKPVILSTGMATVAEIDEAVRTLRYSGTGDIALLKCVSAYPASAEEMNLATLPHMAQLFRCPVGISDHSLNLAIPVAATALGGSIIEKHLTLSRTTPTPDAGFSLEPDDFAAMVREVRSTEKAIGDVVYGPGASEEESIGFRRSLYITRDLIAGERLDQSNCRSIRPGGGLPPANLAVVLGKRINRDVSAGTPLCWSLLLDE